MAQKGLRMASLTQNAFLEKHKRGYRVQLEFAEYAVLKKNSKMQNPFVAKDASGKVLPTPNQIVRTLCKKFKGDLSLS